VTNKLFILVAEDDPNDTLLLKRAFTKNNIDLPVHVCVDGQDAMDYLKGCLKYEDREKYPFPRVLITDLKMPRCSGFDLLAWLQQHPDCNLIPKIVLSASDQEQDVVRAHLLGANCYFRKPGTFAELCDLVRLASEFWSRAVLPPLPPKC
jgi:CheY-like chemotaxis protein